MAHTINALKRIRQNKKLQFGNKMVKSRIKTQIKSVLNLVEKKDIESIKKEFINAVRLLDKAKSKGVLHPNNVARRKSRLSAKVNALLKGISSAGKSSSK